MTYWENTGKYQIEYDLLNKKYVPNRGLYLTADRIANNALIRFVRFSNRYYRFYNDGDNPHVAGVKMKRPETRIWTTYGIEYDEHNEANEQALEKAADAIILKTWKVTKHAMLPVVDEISDAHDTEFEARTKGESWVTERDYHGGKYTHKEYVF